MLTQAHSLANPEAPLIQAGPADQPGKSYEQFYGPDTGAVRAGSAGRVLKVAPAEITVKQEEARSRSTSWPTLTTMMRILVIQVLAVPLCGCRRR